MPSSASTNSRLAVEIKGRARALGFDLAGITTAAPPRHAEAYQQWVADGFHGELGYMARQGDKRVAPEKHLPGARSAIVVGLNYFTGDPPSPDPVRMARYAWGDGDYHDYIGGKLKELAGFIVEQGGRVLSSVDTGPILERDLAQRAGIGFIGKHTNLINRQLGNWIFLGEILTDLELPVDEPEREYCGTCHRCLDACPTQAIVAPYRLDARLCISYLTIELKGSIPVELRRLIGDRVFGCDYCLEVCPWNRFAKQSPVRQFRRRDLPALTEILAWDEARFKEFFRGTPVQRLKRRGFLRNVCVALGNTGDATALPALEHALNDVEPLIREHAAWAVEEIRQRGL